MASGKTETSGASSSQQAAEGETVAVAPPPPSPLPVPQPEPVSAPVEDRDEEVVAAEDEDSPPPPVENVADEPAVQEVAGGEIAPPAGQAAADFACDICGARYPTEKALFGHLRCHKDRDWRGARIPPTFTMDEFAEYQQHLVKPEEEQLREIAEEERRAAAAGAARVALDVDLNVEPEVGPADEFIVPDLNFPPPDEE